MLRLIQQKNINKDRLTPKEKSYVGQHGLRYSWTGDRLAEHFGLPRRTANRYLTMAASNTPHLTTVGRPKMLNVSDLDILKNMVSPDNPYHIKEQEFIDKIVVLGENNKRTRSDAFSTFTTPSVRFLGRLKEELGIKTGNGSIKTQARTRELASKANTIAFAGLLGAIIPLVPPEMVLNTDATQFGSGTIMQDKEKCVYRGPRPKEGLKIQFQEGDRKQSQIISIKWYPTFSSGGFGWHPVYIVEDDEMEEGDIDIHTIMGLGYMPVAGNRAFVAYCKSRAQLNVAYYKWHALEVLIPFVDHIREIYGFSLEVPAYHQLDGETNQIKAYADPATLEAIQSRNIIQAKQNPSQTETEQPNDAGDVFRANKGALKAVTDDHVKHEITLLAKLDEAFASHRAAMKAKIPGYTGLSYQIAKNAKWALLRIRYAHMHVMTAKLIRDGFARVGMVPYSVEVIVANCTTKFTRAEYMQLMDALPRLIKIFRLKGQLTWKDILSVGIDLLGDVNKDEVSLTHKRCIVLTNPYVIAQLAEYKVRCTSCCRTCC